MPVAWSNRFAGSSVLARWAPPTFNNGLDPDTTEGAIDLVYAIPNMHVEYVRAEPPGISTAFWRSVGPSHNVFVTESFMDELAVAAKQDPVAYRLALVGKVPRAKAVLALAAEKAGWGRPLPARTGWGVSLQSVFATYMATVAQVEVSKEGMPHVRRVVCAVDCGTVVNPDTVRAQVQGAIIFGIRPCSMARLRSRTAVSNNPTSTATRCFASTKRRPSKSILCRVRSHRGYRRSRNIGDRSCIINAIYAATSVRLRKLPVDIAALKQPT